MTLNELPLLLAARIKTKRRGLDRVFARKVAERASELVAFVSAEAAKQRVNAERSQRNG